MITRLKARRVFALILGLGAFGVIVAVVVHGAFYAPEAEVAIPGLVATTEIPAQARSIPKRIIIPKIGVDAKVQDVGIGKTGNMAVPSNYSDVGWYRYGPTPGERGSAVIDGHVNNGFGLDAVFKNLNTLKAGDDIYIENASGTKMHFIVEHVTESLAKNISPPEVFALNDKARLNLITCAGAWSAQKMQYDSRVIAYAVLAP